MLSAHAAWQTSARKQSCPRQDMLGAPLQQGRADQAPDVACLLQRRSTSRSCQGALPATRTAWLLAIWTVWTPSIFHWLATKALQQHERPSSSQRGPRQQHLSMRSVNRQERASQAPDWACVETGMAKGPVRGHCPDRHGLASHPVLVSALLFTDYLAGRKTPQQRNQHSHSHDDPCSASLLHAQCSSCRPPANGRSHGQTYQQGLQQEQTSQSADLACLLRRVLAAPVGRHSLTRHTCSNGSIPKAAPAKHACCLCTRPSARQNPASSNAC